MAMKKKISPTPYVEIRWHDAHSDPAGTWADLADMLKTPYEIISVGIWLNDAKEDHVSIAQSVAPHGQYDHILHVPSAMVVSIKSLGFID